MCKNYGELDFRHFVIDKAGNIFGSARVSGTGRIANFLIKGMLNSSRVTAGSVLSLNQPSSSAVRPNPLTTRSQSTAAQVSSSLNSRGPLVPSVAGKQTAYCNGGAEDLDLQGDPLRLPRYKYLAVKN